MESGTLVSTPAAGNDHLPADRPTCRAAIDRLNGEIEAIRAQIAAADLERQARRGKMDPRWYHRARTAIRHKRQQIAALGARMRALPSDRKAGLKDCLIEVLRDEFDDDAWQGVMERAHALHQQRERV
jgi:outer membrane murein-binding lipoprotein Lpp